MRARHPLSWRAQAAVRQPNNKQGGGSSRVPHVHVGGVNDHTLQLCYDALAMIEPSKKNGWERAKMFCCPKVLEHECCPCYFLRVSQSNSWDAAQHLCRYWDERIRLFEGCTFEPLTSGHDGRDPTCLSKSDVEILETGYLQLLPGELPRTERPLLQLFFLIVLRAA